MTSVARKPLSIAFEEIAADKIEVGAPPEADDEGTVLGLAPDAEDGADT